MPPHKSDIGCTLSEAYLQAVSLVAGYPYQLGGRLFDNEGIDAMLDVTKDFGVGARVKSFDVKIQLKHTGTPHYLKNGDISHSAEVATYNKYREPLSANLHLFVLLVFPGSLDVRKWITCTPKQLCIRGAAYYSCVYGADAPSGSGSVTIHYKKRNRLTVDRLESILKMYAMGDVESI